MRTILFASIKTQLFLIVFIVALPAVGVIVYNGFDQRQDAFREARIESRELAEGIASEQENAVAAAQQLLSALAQLPHLQKDNAANIAKIFAKILALNTQYSNIFIADVDGTVWASAVPVKGPFNIRDRRYFINALASGRFSSGEYVISRATGGAAFNFGYPLKDEKGRITGVLGIGFNLELYRGLMKRLSLPNGASYAVFDHNGTILARALHPQNFVGKKDNPELFKKVMEGPDQGAFIGPGLDNRPRFTTYIKFRLRGENTPYMYVRTGVPMAGAATEADMALVRSLGLFAPFLALALLVAYLIAKQSIVDRLVKLQVASHRFAAGDLETRVAEGFKGGELGDLEKSFDEMARQLALREQALRESEEEHRFLADNSADIIWRLTADRRITYINQADERLRGYPREQVLGRLIEELMLPEDAKRLLSLYEERQLQEAAGIKTGITRFETSLVCSDGGSMWVELLSTPIRDEAGQISGFLGVVRDMSERKVYEERLLYMSAHDPLTGLYNRMHFEAEFNRAGKGRNYPLSIIIGDVDGLKKINDTKGHAAGDVVIKSAADILRNTFRVEDLVARIGGDEFAILMPNADEAMVESLIERVQEGERRFNDSGLGVKVRLSLGGATAQTSAELAGLFHKADERMYEEKALHRQAS